MVLTFFVKANKKKFDYLYAKSHLLEHVDTVDFVRNDQPMKKKYQCNCIINQVYKLMQYLVVQTTYPSGKIL